ncbi:MAG: hypothetical protein ACON4T_00370 [Synechococcus sp.]
MDSTPHRTVQRLVRLMSLEEKARLCKTRADAQACIRRAEATKQKLWGQTDQALNAHF